MKPIKDLGMLYQTKKSKQKRRFGLYKCSCGKEQIRIISSVKKEVKCMSCLAIERNLTHGFSHKEALYDRWTHMINRCDSVKNQRYHDYGGRGIKVCKEWYDYNIYRKWALTNGYDKKLSIHRINNDEGYYPKNCIWANRNIQARVTRKLMKTNTSGYRGVSKSGKKWVANITINKKLIYLGRFKSAKKAGEAYDMYVITHKLEHTRNT